MVFILFLELGNPALFTLALKKKKTDEQKPIRSWSVFLNDIFFYSSSRSSSSSSIAATAPDTDATTAMTVTMITTKINIKKNTKNPPSDIYSSPIKNPLIYSVHFNTKISVLQCGKKENYFYLFGGKDESSYALIQGITLAGVLFDEVALMPQSFVDQAIARTLSFKNA